MGNAGKEPTRGVESAKSAEIDMTWCLIEGVSRKGLMMAGPTFTIYSWSAVLFSHS
jgi:hypothetical protein